MANPFPSTAPTDRPRRVFSRLYARVSQRMEMDGMGDLRSELLVEVAGDVVEIGAGNGMNFGHYPGAVVSVVAVEPEPYLRKLATSAAGQAPVPVTVLPGTADRLPLPDHCVDVAVLCLVMCSLDDRPAALAEVRRVLRPGGTVRILEHTIADTAMLRAVQRVADATVWPVVLGGCHTATDPIAAMRAAGFEITALRRFRFPDIRLNQPTSPHVIATARAVVSR